MTIDLSQFGLDINEAAIYSAFLRIGVATVSEVTKEAGVSRTFGYPVIDSLIKKGLVDSVVGEKKKVYKAKHPQALNRLLKKRRDSWKKKQEEFEEVLPDLVRMYKNDQKPTIRFQEGVKGVKELYEEKLNSSTSVLSVLDVDSWKNSEFWPWVNEYHRKRVRKGVHERILLLDTLEGRKWFAEYGGVPENTVYRWVSREYAKKLLQYGGAVDIYEDSVMISLLDQKKKMGVIIESGILANIVRALFELAWSTAEPVVFSS